MTLFILWLLIGFVILGLYYIVKGMAWAINDIIETYKKDYEEQKRKPSKFGNIRDRKKWPE